MKRAFLAATALLSSTILLTAPAFAAVTLISSTPAADPAGLNEANLVLAQGVCDAAAAALDADGPGAQSDIYTGAVLEGAATWVSGPTEVGSHTFAANGIGTQTGAGTFTPAHTEIEGDPYRNGGSVNMFGNAIAVGGHYSASSYDFENNFTTTYAHPFTCDISVQDYHAAVHHDAVFHPAEGHYINCDFGHGQGNDNGGACEDVGQPQGRALRTTTPDRASRSGARIPSSASSSTTQAAYTDPAYDDPEYWDNAVFFQTSRVALIIKTRPTC